MISQWLCDFLGGYTNFLMIFSVVTGFPQWICDFRLWLCDFLGSCTGFLACYTALLCGYTGFLGGKMIFTVILVSL